VFERSAEHVSPRIFGEITPTIGKGLNAAYEGFDGIILIGPFNCRSAVIPTMIANTFFLPRHLLPYESKSKKSEQAIQRPTAAEEV
jgi:hypothetical protein